MAHFSPAFLEFFMELAPNNHKEWFDANRKRYEADVKAPFQAFVQLMIDRIRLEDPKIDIAPKDAIFRINRDIRFAKDKSPYKTNVSAVVCPGGKKNKSYPGIYFELSPDKIKVYGGAWGPDKDQLYDIRLAIANNPKAFSKAINDADFVATYSEIRGQKNVRIPKEFVEAGEKQPLIYNKAFYFYNFLDPSSILEDDFADRIMAHYHAAKPVRDFLIKAMQLD